MTYHAVYIPTLRRGRVIDHPPRRGERLIASSTDHADAFTALEQYTAQRDRWRAITRTITDVVIALVLVGLLLFSEAIIGTERLERRLETLEIPPCEACREPAPVQYSENTSPRIDFPWMGGYHCPEPCID